MGEKEKFTGHPFIDVDPLEKIIPFKKIFVSQDFPKPGLRIVSKLEVLLETSLRYAHRDPATVELISALMNDRELGEWGLSLMQEQINNSGIKQPESQDIKEGHPFIGIDNKQK